MLKVENCCGVCGRLGARLNYNGMTCSSCRVFFYRCVKGKEPDPCPNNGKCVITKLKRGNCGSCRFKRCCELNMETQKVGLRRQFCDLKVAKLSSTAIDFCMTQFHSSLYWRNAVIVPSSLETIFDSHRLSINMGAASPSLSDCNMNISLEELLSTPITCSQRDTACFDAPTRELDVKIKYSLPKSYCRWAVSYADLYQSTHYFSLLSNDDQLKLAQFNFLDFVTLSMLEGYLKSDIPAHEVVTLCERFKISMTKNPTTARGSVVFRQFEGAVAHPLYKEHCFDDVEYTAMKVLALFTPPVTLSEDGVKKINFVREQYTYKLAEHIAEAQFHLPKSEQLVRLKLLLKIVREVKDVAKPWTFFLTDATVNKINDMSDCMEPQLIKSPLKDLQPQQIDNGNSEKKTRSLAITPRKTPPAVSASRLPHQMLVRIFQYLSLGELKNSMLVCKHWNNVLRIEDSPVWKRLTKRIVPESALADPYLLTELTSYKKKLRAFFFAWNSNDVSKNNYVRTNGFTVHRQPVAQSTDGVRGKIGVSSGVHAFELTWEGPLGTVAVIGLATRHAAMHCPGYVPLLGSDDQSWGWNLVDNSLLHNGEQFGFYPRVNNPPKYQMGEKMRMVLDCDRHIAYFERNSDFLGIAFSDLPPVKLYPSVCAVYGNTAISMVYLGAPYLG